MSSKFVKIALLFLVHLINSSSLFITICSISSIHMRMQKQFSNSMQHHLRLTLRLIIYMAQNLRRINQRKGISIQA